MGCKTHLATERCSDDDEESLEEKNDEEDQIEGYSSENDKGCMYRLTDDETSKYVGEWFKFDDPPRHKMILYHGQRFRDVSHFRKVIEEFAIREGFKLCVMENRGHAVSYKFFDLRYDWVIKAGRVVNGRTFVVIEFLADNKCTRLPQQFWHRSKWISTIYLHRWKLQPNLRIVDIRDEIEATVMLVAAALDGNNGILHIAFCEVEVEDLDSWNGEGLCIMGDGDNRIDYVVEEFLPKAAYR
ncbi:hypothetical protein CUMW_172140 [Citrus unshiu]|uniref:Uncharacterized protein n=1 Tax=Citrus unshiu TaxID=55188 RepID=A0A2H5PVR2_CITUN|nr:hypothetical protein CUMW_172140 [Citrus unshiu]